MPKKTFHLPDEYVELFENVKEMTKSFDETISSVFVDAMKKYVEERAEQLQDVDEHFLWEGTKVGEVEATGRLVRFYGKEIARGISQQNGSQHCEVLYYTKKKKFLFYRHLKTFFLNAHP